VCRRACARCFLYAHPEGAAEFAAAARNAGVEHVVLLSSSTVLSPDSEANPIALRHIAAERALDEAGLDRTFVRPGYYATNALRWWQMIRTGRVLRTAFPDAVTSPVHERDIAQVAVRALLDDTHRGAAYPVLGAGPVTVREQVAAIAGALGEPVRLEKVDVDTYRAQLLTQLPGPIVERVLQDRGSVPPLPAELATDAVPEILGRPALTFANGPATTQPTSANRMNHVSQPPKPQTPADCAERTCAAATIAACGVKTASGMMAA
jgi:uncharacterized protein YbjT (DUF2867 family)